MPQLLDCYLFEVNHRYKYKDPITSITKYFKSVPTSAIWRLAKKIMGYLIILIKGQRMMYFVSKNATFTNQSQFHNLVTQ